MKHIVGVAWFSSRATVGIVIYTNQMGTHKAVIGVANSEDEDVDILSIASFGAKFPLKEALSLIKDCGEIKDSKSYASAVESLNTKEGK